MDVWLEADFNADPKFHREEVILRRVCEAIPDDAMGNGTSQSVVLGHSRIPAGVPYYQHRYQQRAPNYAHPHNRVLPKPIAGQRLRSTDNGHILHSAGTIRGLKPGSPTPEAEIDPEVVDALKKRSELLNREQDDCHRYNLQNYRMFHSDPDISGRSRDSSCPLGTAESAVSRRAGGGAANKATKLKHRKKAKAPDPPPNENLSRQYERRVQSSSDLRYLPENSDYRCTNASPQEWAKTKCKAPLPPSIGNNPPPPPPPPLPSRTTTTCAPLQNDPNQRVNHNGQQQPAYKLLDFSPQKNSHDKQCRPDDNWRLSRSVGDLRMADDQNFKSDSPRPTVFDSKNISNPNYSATKPALLPHPPDPFQKEIQAVTRQIAHSQQRDTKDKNGLVDNPQKSTKQANPPKPYYFSDKDVFKNESKPQPKSSPNPPRDPFSFSVKSNIQIASSNDKECSLVQTKVNRSNFADDGKAPPLQRFSPNRRRLTSPFKNPSLPLDETNRGDCQYIQSYPLDGDSDIDIRLRPVLPRKTLDIPKFSPIEAWHALGSDEHDNSPRCTSDESTHHYKGNGKRFLQNDASSKPVRCYRSNKEATFDERHWTPRQDLEDSDTSSINSEEVVVPKSQFGEFSTTFSLPTVMFSNMRPIGTELPLNNKINGPTNPHRFNQETHGFRSSKEKPVKNLSSNPDLNAVSHFKKFLGMRNKYLSEEDVSVSDSNWTFGGSSALQQKKGKHYSSDLMLSDKKKYELIVKNDFGDFLGNILVSKANGVRNMLPKSSDSSNSNFSFYSTEGHVVYLPDSDSHLSGNNVSPNRGRARHNNVRKVNKTDQTQSTPKNYNKKLVSSDSEKRRGIELMRMLENDARRRRSKEKISIRQQLQMIKQIESDDDDEEDEVDEAYFTEPKSLEEMSPRHVSPQPHFHFPGIPNCNRNYCEGGQIHPPPTLTHWTSTPALFHDVGIASPPKSKGYHSNVSLNSSPECPVCPERQVGNEASKKKQFFQNRRLFEKHRSLPEEDCLIDGRSSSEDFKLSIENSKKTSSQPVPPKDKKTHSVYKQLMDIVRKEERQMKKAQGNDCLSASRESSYSQRESSHSSTSSRDSVSSSTNSYTDCSDHRKHHREVIKEKSGIPANNEFHTSSGVGMDRTIGIQVHDGMDAQESKHLPSAFHAAFAKPFMPNKGYRPVPFEVPAATSNCRLLTVQGHKVPAQVS